MVVGDSSFGKGGGIGWDASDEETFVEIIDGLVEVQLVEASVLELALGYGVRRAREDLRKGTRFSQGLAASLGAKGCRFLWQDALL